MIEIKLNEQESALLVQALSLVRASDEFTANEQAILKHVAEQIAEVSPEGTTDGVEKGD